VCGCVERLFVVCGCSAVSAGSELVSALEIVFTDLLLLMLLLLLLLLMIMTMLLVNVKKKRHVPSKPASVNSCCLQCMIYFCCVHLLLSVSFCSPLLSVRVVSFKRFDGVHFYRLHGHDVT